MRMVVEVDCTPQDLKHYVDLCVEAFWVESGRARWRSPVSFASLVIGGVLFTEIMSRNLDWPYAGVAMLVGGSLFTLVGVISTIWRYLFRRDPVPRTELFVTPTPGPYVVLDWTCNVVVPVVVFAAIVVLHQTWPLPAFSRRAWDSMARQLLLSTWLVLFFLVARFLIARFRSWLAMRRMWKTTPRMGLIQRLEASHQGIVIDDMGTRTEIRWTALERFVESPAIFVIAMTDGQIQFFPKRCFTVDQADEFRALLRMYLHGPARGFPVQPVLPPVPGNP